MDLLKRQKILLVLFRLSKHSKMNLKFEDIVVALFKKYPEEFQLKGYQQYPDSAMKITPSGFYQPGVYHQTCSFSFEHRKLVYFSQEGDLDYGDQD